MKKKESIPESEKIINNTFLSAFEDMIKILIAKVDQLTASAFSDNGDRAYEDPGSPRSIDTLAAHNLDT